MNALLRSLSMGTTLPHGQFFKPNELFWEQLSSFKDTTILEAGCGIGATLEEAIERNFRITGCDLNMRDGVNTYGRLIHIMDAMRFPIVEGMTVLVCRPDHSGWCEELLERCIDIGCTFIYVGLPSNFHQDFQDQYEHDIIATDIGKDGEFMVKFN